METSPDLTTPLSLVPPVIAAEAKDLALLDEIVTSAGGTLVEAQRTALGARLAEARVLPAFRAGLAYAHSMLYAGDLKRLVRMLGDGAVPSPHGAEPRSLVYRRELDALLAEAGRGALPFEAAEALGAEVGELRKVGRRVASGRAALLRVRADLTEIQQLAPEQQAVAIGTLCELVTTELADAVAPSVDRSEQALTDGYYPVSEKDPGRLLIGDIVFSVTKRAIVHEVTQEVPDRADSTYLETLRMLAAELTATPPTTVVLRPVGRQATLALRLRAVSARLQALAGIEEKLATRYPKEAHLGRAQGLNVAYELLTGPSWTLPPAVWNAPAEKPAS